MSDTSANNASELDFATLIARIRQGDQEAATLVVRHYEPIIRREVRLTLVDPRLSRLFDSIDVSQSVFASFFSRSNQGQYDLQDADQLVALLLRMARNKLATRCRDAKRRKRDIRRSSTMELSVAQQLISSEPDPSERLAQAEHLESIRNRLSPSILVLLDLRSQHLSWPAIARRIGGTAHARRVQLMRGLKAAKANWDL